jgi:hypothetical protein
MTAVRLADLPADVRAIIAAALAAEAAAQSSCRPSGEVVSVPVDGPAPRTTVGRARRGSKAAA